MKHKYGVTAAIEILPDSYPVVLRGDFSQTAEKAKAAGFDAIELHLRNPKQIDGEELLKIADKNDIKFCGIATGLEFSRNKLSLIDTNEDIRNAAVIRLQEHVDLAKILGCPVIIGIMRSNIPDFADYELYENLLTDSLSRVDAYAEKNDVPIVLENINRYINNYLCTTKDTYDYLDKINLPNTTLHLDTHSMNIEDVDMNECIRYSAKLLTYMHFSDSNRLRPGLGHMDFKGMLQTLDDIGYDGYISVECLPLPDPIACMTGCMEYLKQIEEA